MVLKPATPRVVLFVVPVSDLGGVARHVLDIDASGLPGWRPVFLTPPGPLVDALRDRGGAVVSAPLGPAYGLGASVRTVRHTVSRLRPAVVHTHLAYADIATALAVTDRRVALVSTEHGIAGGDAVYHGSAAASRLMALVHRVRTRRFDALLAVSRATADAMAAKWGTRGVTVIRNGVDAGPVLARKSGLRVLSLARLAPEKRIDSLVEAFTMLHARHPSARLTIAGTGPAGPALQRLVDGSGISSSIDLPGHCDPHDALARADVVAQLSVWENCSYTLLDAARLGLGVVASPVGGNPEMLPAACLVEPTDPERVADALEVQGLKPELRPELPGWPSVATMCADIAAVYDRLEGRP